MPVAISPQQIDAQPSVLRRKRWTRDDVRAVAATGAFNNSRYELINGELIDKLGMNPPHSTSLVAISGQLIEFFGWRFVRTQMPIDVAAEDNANSEPEPDVCVTNAPFGTFANRLPGPQDIVLLVEVSDTTLSFDTKDKAGLYARAGILDYWVLDVNKRRIIVHRSPAHGEYQSLTVYSGTEPVSPLAAHASVRLALHLD